MPRSTICLKTKLLEGAVAPSLRPAKPDRSLPSPRSARGAPTPLTVSHRRSLRNASRSIVRLLFAWFAEHQRDLPWRRTHDPYAIWVSEVMLQQTRVGTVIPYYEKFLQRFPTPQHAVEAGESAVLSMWTGLGYYRRARLLFRGLEQLVSLHGGRVPMERRLRRALPGVGDYTSGAIGSIAFDLPEPAVDGNVTRVLSRLFRVPDSESKVGKKRIGELATALVLLSHNPAAWNQALMELGALICLPTRSRKVAAADPEAGPKCTRCPLNAQCAAFLADEVSLYPAAKIRSEKRDVAIAAVWVWRKNKILVIRNHGALFGGLYGPLWCTVEDANHAQQGVVALLRAARIQHTKLDAVGSVRHTLTHRELRADVYQCETMIHEIKDESAIWISPKELGTSFATATFFQKMMSIGVNQSAR